MNITRLLFSIALVLSMSLGTLEKSLGKSQSQDTLKVDREYFLESTMLGYFGIDGTRNPVLKANKGDVVRITITNGELMTHDIAMEKLGIKSDVIVDKGATAFVVFTADQNDTYYCSIPGHRTAGMVGEFKVVQGVIGEKETIVGELPTTEGRAMNFDFEGGTTIDWVAKGDAFLDPLVMGEPSNRHEKELHIGQNGRGFITSGGTANYQATGTLTSKPFTVTQPFASFMVSGGALQDVRVELIDSETDEVFFQISGSGRATLQPVVVDLEPYLRKSIYIRLVDNETGISQIPYIADDRMGHLNFDDFKFYSARPSFPNELKKQDIIVLPPLDYIPNAGLSGQKAALAMELPEGFSIKLAAQEPEIVRPISFTLDARGRLWVVEAHTYPVRAENGKGRDRILIFEDTDGDGSLDKRIVFMEGLNLVSGIEVGLGGVWLGAAPNLLFIPIDAKADKPAGPAQILLDGWGYQDTHEVLNNLRWGPDGWLYGTQGVFTDSNVGKPGDPDEKRQKINAGYWRYHPVRKEFEVFSEGTSNPWGIDFNEYGQLFSTVCVIPHLFHVIQGAKYHRQAGSHFNPYAYDDIKTIADHVHWVGDRGPHAGNFRSAAVGGGHAHAGAMIYLGGDSWPSEYRDNIFMNNINGARVNNDKLIRKGSGYTAKHEDDFLITNDSWSQWLNFRYDASGSVFVIDWYDKNQCHSPNPEVHDKHLGRIFKISHEHDQWVQVDLSKLSDQELVRLQLHENEWYVRQSRLVLQERGANKKVHKALLGILEENADDRMQLRALWTLHVTGGLTEKKMLELLSSESEYLRSWAIQLLVEDKDVSTAVREKFTAIASADSSALVRLYLASAIQRMAPEPSWAILEGLYQHEEDKDDHNLPLMLWYAAEPLVELDLDRALDLAIKAKIPLILTYTIRRIAELKTPESLKALEQLSVRLKSSKDEHRYHDEQQLIAEVLKQDAVVDN